MKRGCNFVSYLVRDGILDFVGKIKKINTLQEKKTRNKPLHQRELQPGGKAQPPAQT
jgi:hypothetical protein